MLVRDQLLPQSGFIYRSNLYHANKSPWPWEWTQSNVIACKAQPDKIWANLNIYLFQWSRLSQTCSWIRRGKKGCNLADTGCYRVGKRTSIGCDNMSFYLVKCFILKGECGTTHNAPAGRLAWQDLEYSHWCFRCIGCWHWSLQPLSLLAQGCYNASSLQMHQLKVPIRYQCSTPYSTSPGCRIIFVRARCVFCSLRNLLQSYPDSCYPVPRQGSVRGGVMDTVNKNNVFSLCFAEKERKTSTSWSSEVHLTFDQMQLPSVSYIKTPR